MGILIILFDSMLPGRILKCGILPINCFSTKLSKFPPLPQIKPIVVELRHGVSAEDCQLPLGISDGSGVKNGLQKGGAAATLMKRAEPRCDGAIKFLEEKVENEVGRQREIRQELLRAPLMCTTLLVRPYHDGN